MRFNEKIYNAITTASIYHNKQTRKANPDLPYISHPYAVAMILTEYTDNENTIVAALLHDIIEDTNYSKEQLKNEFGPDVFEIVMDLTEVERKNRKKASWQEHKENYLKNLQTAREESLMICAADKSHNMLSLIYLYEKIGDDMWKFFHTPIEKTIWFNNEALKILRNRLIHPIVNELDMILAKGEKLFIKNENK